MKALLLALFAFTAQASELDIARSAGWQRLLYYKTHLIGGWKSAVDGSGFFLAPDGATNPEAELLATMKALEIGGGTFGKLQQPIGCAFPLRKAFLEEALGKKFPAEPCPEFEDFLRKLNPAGVALVFATAYPNNPASMFGHSFLKVRSKQNQGLVPLLDWSLNYAAMVPPEENPFAFAFFGLTGGYAGQFALVPYYAKIEEYGNLEGRDIWEYDLNLTQAELLRLVQAVWEIETNSHLYYYFFDENCSFQVLTLLEAVRPDWNLSGYFLHMIPGESVKAFTRLPGATGAVRMRPSLERKLQAMVRAISSAEREQFDRAKRVGPGELKGGALSAYIYYLQAEKKRQGTEWTHEARLWQALKNKAAEGGAEPVTELGGERTRPDLSHGAYQLGLGPVREPGGNLGAELSIRFAYHDLLDADSGFTPHSEVLFPNFRFRYLAETGRLSLHEAELYSIVSLTPWNEVRKPLAWRTKISFGRTLDLGCATCRALHAEAGVGSAFSLLPERFTLWAMVGGGGDWGAKLPGNLRGEPWAEVGSLFTLPTEGKILFASRLLKSFGRGGGWRGEFQYAASHPFSTAWALRAEGRTSVRWVSPKETVSDFRILALRYF
jgi:hypothetical protein